MSGLIDHIAINVSDYARAKQFYAQALAPLGVSLIMEYGSAAGFGRDKKPELWLGAGKSDFQSEDQLEVITPIHVCLAARSRAEVEAFHAAALAAGGRDNGAPGIRAHYHAGYYGAFAIDPDGHNIEAVFHEWS
ncbi:MAG TPA: VOC family protein [Polyangiaceae bacterium]|jgi:catechol 2,3-dioxygenase-like lactoylglutathione lyase family enzyme|nr:VOC family protein [Polyangiaceae bacterium]